LWWGWGSIEGMGHMGPGLHSQIVWHEIFCQLMVHLRAFSGKGRAGPVLASMAVDGAGHAVQARYIVTGRGLVLAAAGPTCVMGLQPCV